METVSIQIPAKLFAAIYARHEGNTGNVINQYLTQLLKESESDSSSKTGIRPKRPGRKTVSRRVWSFADTYLREAGKADRSAVVKLCVEDGINMNTAQTQFTHWKNATINSEE